MKILIYESDKGLAPYTSCVANELAKLGNEIIYMTSKDNPYRDSLDKRVRDYCILLQVTGKYKRKTIGWAFDRVYKCIHNIIVRNKIIKKEKPDIVNIHSTIYLLDKFLLRKSRTSKYVMTIHNVESHEKTFDDKSKIQVWKKQDGLIVHTPENVDELFKEYGIKEKVYLVPHGADVSYNFIDKKICRDRYGIDLDKIVLLAFGILRDYKGTDVLIDALQGINECTLFLAGQVDPSTKEHYEKQMKSKGIDYIWIDGFIPEEEIPYIFQSCDMAVLPYKYFNSQSGVLLRIATYNLPVIASDVGDFKRFVNAYNMGIICQPNDSKSLHDAIIRMTSDNNREQYAQGAKRAALNNSWEHAAECYSDAFSTVMHQGL